MITCFDGKVFKIVGNVQYEVSKSLDLYGTKKQYDEKRQIFDQHRMRVARGRLKKGKGDTQNKVDAQSDQELQAAKEDFDNVSRFLSCRLISLEQGRAQSLITQAARHHAAQMHLLTRGLTSLHGIEPFMKQISQEHNIDRRLSPTDKELFDDADDDEAGSVVDVDDGSYTDDHEQEHEQELDDGQDSGSESFVHEAGAPVDLSQEWNSLLEATVRHSQNGTYANDDDIYSPVHHPWKENGSRSAPTSPLVVAPGVDNIQEIDVDSPDQFISGPPPKRSPPMPSNANRGHSSSGGGMHHDMLALEYYPLTSGHSPTTHGLETTASSHLESSIHVTPPPRVHGQTTKMGVPMLQSFEPPPNSWPMPLPPESTTSPPIVNFGAPPLSSSTSKGFVTLSSSSIALSQNKKRYSHSGPLISPAAPWYRSTVTSSGPIPSKVSNSGPLVSSLVNHHHHHHHHSSGQKQSPGRPTYSSPQISPPTSPPKMSTIQISELHKLPPPPLSASSSSMVAVCAPSPIAHSAPLTRAAQSDHSTLNASPLPLPPLNDVTTGNFPTGGRAAVKLHRQQRSMGPSITELSQVTEEEIPFTSSRWEETDTQKKQPSTASCQQNQTGTSGSSLQVPKLQRSASGSGGTGVSWGVTNSSSLDYKAPAKSHFGSVDICMWRISTSRHSSSPGRASAYSVTSPTSAAAVYSVKEKAQAGSAFEHGRRSLDGKVPANAIDSKWSNWS
ncbi:hypothetical protein CY35_17G019600 [Sphagnum magellanicum]|nr:hypothetical protein CY35_17G019600 [Sphagnum magellanicum]